MQCREREREERDREREKACANNGQLCLRTPPEQIAWTIMTDHIECGGDLSLSISIPVSLTVTMGGCHYYYMECVQWHYYYGIMDLLWNRCILDIILLFSFQPIK